MFPRKLSEKYFPIFRSEFREGFSGANFWILGTCRFWGAVLHMFLFHCVEFFGKPRRDPQELSENNVIFRSAFRESFGSEPLVFGRLCSVKVLWCFFAYVLFHCVALFPRSCLKNVLFLRLCFFFRKFSGTHFWVLEFVRGCWLLSETLSFFRVVFRGDFSGRNFWYLAFVFGRCFLVLFCRDVCFIAWFCSPENCLKMCFFP